MLDNVFILLKVVAHATTSIVMPSSRMNKVDMLLDYMIASSKTSIPVFPGHSSERPAAAKRLVATQRSVTKYMLDLLFIMRLEPDFER